MLITSKIKCCMAAWRLVSDQKLGAIAKRSWYIKLTISPQSISSGSLYHILPFSSQSQSFIFLLYPEAWVAAITAIWAELIQLPESLAAGDGLQVLYQQATGHEKSLLWPAPRFLPLQLCHSVRSLSSFAPHQHDGFLLISHLLSFLYYCSSLVIILSGSLGGDGETFLTNVF